jgi:hypothetical protein
VAAGVGDEISSAGLSLDRSSSFVELGGVMGSAAPGWDVIEGAGSAKSLAVDLPSFSTEDCSIDGRSMELRLPMSVELRGDATVRLSPDPAVAFFAAMALAKRACRRSLVRFVEEEREFTGLGLDAGAGEGFVAAADDNVCCVGGCDGDCCSSPSPSMLSSRDSTPATACDRKDPHRVADGFPGAAILPRRGRRHEDLEGKAARQRG